MKNTNHMNQNHIRKRDSVLTCLPVIHAEFLTHIYNKNLQKQYSEANYYINMKMNLYY